MSTPVQEPPVHYTSSEERDSLVRQQLDRLLLSVHFRNSRRYPALLRYIVEQTLLGHRATLKERTLGIEVFGRPVDYDTAADPIVRVTIAEIRKRIAQYYHEEAHTAELRIELNPGSYIPEFLDPREPESHLPPAEPHIEPVEIPERTTPELLTPSARRRWIPWALYSSLCAILLCAGVLLARATILSSSMDRMWAPVFAESGPITFCLPISFQKNKAGDAATTNAAIAHALDVPGTASPAAGETFFNHQVLGENVVYSDVVAMTKLESVIERQHRPVRVRLNVGTNLNDLREGPTVFIGGLDNQWTLKLLEPLRYRFAGSDAKEYYIRDANAPGDRRWQVRLQDKVTVVKQDYALIARIHSASLERVVVVVAGIGMSGTAAAGEFLADPAQVQELERRIGYRNRDRDFEAVLETDVDDGIAGAARIVALDIR
ncbi:MAG: hypothetical protein ACRYF4_05720 [Janthinobacterium lividum]